MPQARYDQATKLGALAAFDQPRGAARGHRDERSRRRIEEGSSQLVERVAGEPAVVKAAARKAKAVKQVVAKTVKQRPSPRWRSCARTDAGRAQDPRPVSSPPAAH